MSALGRRSFTTLLLAASSLPAQSAVLRMAFFDRYPPLSHRDAKGRLVGLLVELVDAVGELAGLQFSHHGYPWARAQAMVRDGGLDGVCTTVNPARQAYLLFCDTPLVVLQFGICHRRSDARIGKLRTVAELRQLRQGNYRGSGYTQHHLEPERVQFDHDPDSVLRRIAMGDLDVYVDAELSTLHRLRALGLEGQLEFSLVPFLLPAAYCFGLRRSLPTAAAVVQRMEAATQSARTAGRLQAVANAYR
jgi:polar amino acid transport system substrate-binding protein